MTVHTSLMIASFVELQKAIQGGFVFPALAIPFGAGETTHCCFFIAGDDVTEENFQGLLKDSYPMMDGIRRIHLITRAQSGISLFNPGPIFCLIES